ncbi:unnamed protein product [Rhizophagus irregularis]|nr:unnamed protein product [Rhizophagus irregularis]
MVLMENNLLSTKCISSLLICYVKNLVIKIQINSSLFEIIILDNDYIDSSDGINYLKENHNYKNTFIEAYPPDDEYATDSDNLESQNENLERLQNESV